MGEVGSRYFPRGRGFLRLMGKRRASAFVTLGLVTGFATPLPVAVAKSVVYRLDERTPVVIHEGIAAWSRGSGPYAKRRWRLVVRKNGKNVVVPVGSRGVPFDVDLGRDSRGRPVAVYSRCKRDPDPEADANPAPTYTDGVGCRLYSYDLRSGVERRLRHVSRRGFSQTTPAVWNGNLVFARTDERNKRHATSVVYVPRRGSARRLPGGTAGQTEGGRLGTALRAIDLRGRRVAFTWDLLVRQCPGQQTPTYSPTVSTELWQYEIGRPAVKVAAACEAGFFYELKSPSATSSGVAAMAACLCEGVKKLLMTDVRGDITLQPIPKTVEWLSRDRDNLALEEARVETRRYRIIVGKLSDYGLR